MPLTKTWGPLTLQKTEIPDNDSTLSLSDREKVAAVSQLDCFPPPASITDYVRRQEIRPQHKRASLQDIEKHRLGRLPVLMGGRQQSARNTRRIIHKRLEFTAMDIDYDNDEFRNLRQHHDCFTSTIYLRVKYSVAEVKATANEDLRVGDESFSAGDDIVTYRVLQPTQYRFEVHHVWSSRCCPDKPAHEREAEHSNYVYPIEEIEVTAPRIRLDDGLRFEGRFRLDRRSNYSPFRDDYLDDDD